MSVPTRLDGLRRRIRELRIKSASSRRFIPEGTLTTSITRDEIRHVVAGFISPPEKVIEVVEYIITQALKVFSILAMSHHVNCIECFIHQDQLQPRRLDDLLPFSKETLHQILDDAAIEADFYETQWEFTSPVFSGKITIRALDRQTILPYLYDAKFAAGAYRSAHKIGIHPYHRPRGYERLIEVSLVTTIINSC